MEIAPTVSQSFSEPEPTIRLSYLVYSSILLDARGVGQVCPHRLQLKKKNIFFKTAIPKLGHKLTFLGSHSLQKFRKKLGGRSAHPPCVLKGPKSAGFYRVKGSSV